MLTKLRIRNFKRFGDVEIELGNPVAFIGPNNSGKTSAMQALALWDIGVKRLREKRSGRSDPERRPGITVNRRDLMSIPVPNARLLWQGLHVRDVERSNGTQRTQNVRIDIIVEGVTEGRQWECGLEFDYTNPESFYCRPLRRSDGKLMSIPDEMGSVQVAFLPPMSGLAATETRLDQGAVNVRVGEGRTAEVLRNLCYRVHEERNETWRVLVAQIDSLFGATLDPPRYIEERGEVAMTYRERGMTLDLSSSGRGLQQTMLILAFMYANPGAVLMLDEPDAHLEILRQRQTYQLIADVAAESESQIIAASHSEVILNEAAERDVVVAFVGKPHRIDDRGSQVRKALREIGFEHYYQAEQTGWVLYLEGSTDLAILRAFAKRLGHQRAVQALERPYVLYVANQVAATYNHFNGLKEALPQLQAIALFDRLERRPPDSGNVYILEWRRREIENYLSTRATLEGYAKAHAVTDSPGPLFTPPEISRRRDAMDSAIESVSNALQTLNRGSPWDPGIKSSEEFLQPLFEKYFAALELGNIMSKTNFHVLAQHVPEDEIDPEISEKLDAIAEVAESATPGGLPE